NTPPDEHSGYEEDIGDPDLIEEATEDDDPMIETNINFLKAEDPSTHECKTCGLAVDSRNKLFSHLRSSCWKKEKGAKASPKIETTSSQVMMTKVSLSAPEIIPSSAKPIEQIPGYAFRGYQYTMGRMRLSPEGLDLDVCFDTGCPITVGDKDVLSRHIPDLESIIRQTPSPIPVSGFGNKVTKSTEYVVIDLYIPGTLNGKAVMGKITAEVHLTTELNANILVGSDVMTPHGIDLKMKSQIATINSCKQMEFRVGKTGFDATAKFRGEGANQLCWNSSNR
ncbi:MAG: hypothetical protein Q9164_007942, partial [Protoblastenia rupestris]